MPSISMPARTYPRAKERLMKPKRHNSLPTTPQTSADASGTSNTRIAVSTERTAPASGTESHRRHRHHHRQALHHSSSRQAQNQRESLPSPPSSQHHYHKETAYDLTSHCHASVASHYQLASTPGLPSATRWPHQCSVADRGRIENDLLGLDLGQPSYDPYSMATRIPEEEFECASYLGDSDVKGGIKPAGGAAVYGTWRSEEGAIFAWDNDVGALAGRMGYAYDLVSSIDEYSAAL